MLQMMFLLPRVSKLTHRCNDVVTLLYFIFFQITWFLTLLFPLIELKNILTTTSAKLFPIWLPCSRVSSCACLSSARAFSVSSSIYTMFMEFRSVSRAVLGLLLVSGSMNFRSFSSTCKVNKYHSYSKFHR